MMPWPPGAFTSFISGDKWEKEVNAGMGSRKATQPPKKHNAIYDDVKGLICQGTNLSRDNLSKYVSSKQIIYGRLHSDL